jgi:hypothetical protein
MNDALSNPERDPDPDLGAEHFVTLFDSYFLPIGLSLHASLMTHARPFHLWVVCMEDKVHAQLLQLNHPHLTPIPLHEVETPALLGVKGARTRQEYCWTLTPFTLDPVFQRCPAARRVTYLDADLFFFADPRELLNELDASGRSVLATEHAYAPRYDQSRTAGRFCVQFMTFAHNERARRVIKWWQDRCIECCSAIPTNGKFGDQVYVDQWPDLFGDDLCVVQQTSRTLAPWNVSYFCEKAGGDPRPVFYHFHGLRITSPGSVRLHAGFYEVSGDGLVLYERYLAVLKKSLATMHEAGMPTPCLPLAAETWAPLRRIVRRVRGVQPDRYASILDQAGDQP